ncbi:N-6 DNA methylase [Herbaspirillum sp. YR522]|uniref:Eco57I restriction-modification methylase domain-containing protein n=1 Tax=Herbaspirillum sp. YR522 TaxID=1144342 RepID=UPI000301C066|nr:N-6 DNA methylase [Herbaspirillum sp. YR522]
MKSNVVDDFRFPYAPTRNPISEGKGERGNKQSKGTCHQISSTARLKQQFTRHVRSIGLLAANYQEESKYLSKKIGTIVVLWSKRQAPALSCAGLEYLSSLAKTPEVQRFVDWLCQQDFLEGAYWLSSAYSIWAGVDYRKQLAMFFTPPSLTKRLLDDLENAGASFVAHSFFDPACGGAAFLAPIAQRMKAALKALGKTPTQIIRHVEDKLFGTDLDPLLCRMSCQFLSIVLAEEIAAIRATPNFHVSTANSLVETADLHGKLDVIVCNPPYRKMPADEVALYREHFVATGDPQPNLYSLFLELGLKLLRPTGMAGFVTPTSFMSGRYFSKLRTYLLENSHIANIGIVSDRAGIFIDVEQETALTILKRRVNSGGVQTSANVSVVSKQGDFKSVGSCNLPGGGYTWPIPRAEGDADLIRIISTSKYRLSDYGFLPRTGCFVWNRDKRATFYHPSEARAADATAAYPLLWSSDITTDGEVQFGHSKKAMQEPSYVDVGNNSSPSIQRRPSLVLQRVTSNDQPLRLVAGVVPAYILQRHGGFVCENHVLALESLTEEPRVPLELLVKLLGSWPVDRYFRSISGANNVSIFELQQLPLPGPTRLMALVKEGLPIDEAVLKAYR